MKQTDIDNMNYALISGQINPKILKTNERAYKTIHTIVTNHYCGERSEAIKMIFADLRNKAEKILHQGGSRNITAHVADPKTQGG